MGYVLLPIVRYDDHVFCVSIYYTVLSYQMCKLLFSSRGKVKFNPQQDLDPKMASQFAIKLHVEDLP